MNGDHNQRGASYVEYLVILVVVGLGLAATWHFFGGSIGHRAASLGGQVQSIQHVPVCGDDVCETGEDVLNCQEDCRE